MDLYEHQGKDLFEAHGIPLAERGVAETPGEARRIAEELGGRTAVKAQVQIGGRGKGGGVVLTQSPEEAEEAARRILDGGFQGMPVTRVLVEKLVDLAEQFYVAISLDRSTGAYLAIASAEGGVDIEEVARERPDALRRLSIDPLAGIHGYQTRWLAGHFDPDARAGSEDVLRRMYDVLVDADASLVEINPLVLLKDGSVVALDSKVTVDDNALFRHRDLAELESSFPRDPVEARARAAGLQYVKLDGEVGIIGNGAGLVMSTLDVVQQAGASAANFLDIGGASAESMAMSLEVILSDPGVRVVFINIFGGITRCDVVADGIVAALERVEPAVSLVVRLDGTNAEEGRRILAEANHPRIVPAETMLEAAKVAASLAREASA
jgi:succinyl-CoA synthetase beta subunit